MLEGNSVVGGVSLWLCHPAAGSPWALRSIEPRRRSSHRAFVDVSLHRLEDEGMVCRFEVMGKR